MISQVLFGQHFKVLEFKKNWVKIILYSDHYEGWICSKQYMEIEKQYYDQLSLSIPEFSIGKTSYLVDLVDSSEIAIPMGSTLPFFFNGLINIKGKNKSYDVFYSEKNKIKALSFLSKFKYSKTTIGLNIEGSNVKKKISEEDLVKIILELHSIKDNICKRQEITVSANISNVNYNWNTGETVATGSAKSIDFD